MDLPILDLAALLGGTMTTREELCRALLHECKTFGFVKLVNHGISDEQVAALFDWSKRYFDLPEDVKRQSARPTLGGPNRGWSAIGQEKLSGITGFSKGLTAVQSFEDVKESFDQGPMADVEFPNVWPPEHALPGFRAWMESFYDTCIRVHSGVLRALEMALQLPKNRLALLCSHGNAELRLAHYPAIDVVKLRSGTTNRISEHTDLGVLTLLFQDTVGGLEVEDQNHYGSFLPLECGSRGEMIVNIADTLSRWTNDTLRSANHRVTIPRHMKDIHNGTVPARLSVGFFGKANPEMSLRPMAEFALEASSRYDEDITAQNYYHRMQEKTYPVSQPGA